LIYSPPPTLCVDIPLFSSTPPNDEMRFILEYERLSGAKLDGRTKAFSQEKKLKITQKGKNNTMTLEKSIT